MARGRQKLEINKVEFQAVVDRLELERVFANATELWKAVEATDWAKNLQPRPLTFQVAYLRAKELGITTKTQPGKRGPREMSPELIARMREARGKRTPRADKMRQFAETFELMRKNYPSLLLPLIEKAAAGSLRAAITLKCKECSAFQRSEVVNCQCVDCALYPHRPNQNGVEEIETDDAADVLAEAAAA